MADEFTERKETSTVTLKTETLLSWLKVAPAIIGMLAVILFAILATKFQTIAAADAFASQYSQEYQRLSSKLDLMAADIGKIKGKLGIN